MGVNSTYRAFGQIISSDIDLSDRLPRCKGTASIKISLSKFKVPPTQLTNVYRRNVQARFAENKEAYFMDWGEFGQFKITKSNEIFYQNSSSIKELQMFLLSEVIGIAIWNLGYFCLHASAATINNEVHIFTGEAGMGKSSILAALWQKGASVVSDDLVVISTKVKEIKCEIAMPEIKIWEQTADGLQIDKTSLIQSSEGIKKYLLPIKNENFKSKRIKSINIISRDLQNSILPPIELLKYFPLPQELLKGEKIKRHFEQSTLIAKACDISFIQKKTSFEELKNWATKFYAK